MAKEIRLNAFAMNCAGHLSAGLWSHPRDQSHRYTELAYWTDLARLLERGKFDALFLADVLGVYDVYAGTPDAALRQATQVPVNDPVLLIPAMAAVTANLGFGVTCTLSFEPPYPFARRMSTLDHLTKGRVAWNIVTGYLDSAARGVGRDSQSGHDLRYTIADDYMEVVYRLWEGSWEDDAVVRDRERGVFADPAKVHKVHHEGPYYRVDAIHLAEPSPQRTPLLYQAGSSSRGREFAGRHAECVFLTGASKRAVKETAARIREQAALNGRNPDDILMFAAMTVIVGRTETEARAKQQEYSRYIKPEAALALYSGWTGIDFAPYALDDPLRYEKSEAIHSAVEAFARTDRTKAWTVRGIIDYLGLGGPSPKIIGSPEQVADELEAWVTETGIDGFNLAYVVMPETFTDLVEMVIPELQRRGVYKREYQTGTLREKLYGVGRARLPASHPASRHRVARSKG